MAQETLSVKLCELDDSLGRLHSRIRVSETASHDQLRRDIHALERECIQEERRLLEHLRRSKSELAPMLVKSYGQIEQILERSKLQMAHMAAQGQDREAAAEEKVLLAEYMLDVAYRVADRVLLLSMEAIDAQQWEQKEGGAQ